MQKTILITGCSSGIGFDAATTLRARGWRVFASCRQAADCDRLKAMGFDSPRIDYSDTDSIRSGFAEVIAATGGRLDALFNNGAYGMSALAEDLPTDALRAMFEVNFFGWHELTLLALPVMRAQGGGRIVQCSSTLGFVTIPWRAAYSASKHAMEAVSDTLRVEMRGTGVHVIVLRPGPITTDFRKNTVAPFERWIDWRNAPRRADYERQVISRLYTDSGKDLFELPAAAVTAKLVRALESARPRPRYAVTTPTYIADVLKRILGARAIDAITARL